jgi:hypothetical protein
MGIQVEFNPDLALRHISEFRDGKRKREECIPENIQAGQVYDFLKKGQRNYWLEGEIPLVETEGNQHLSKPIASIVILETTHTLVDRTLWTKGRYKVIDIFDKNGSTVHFNGFARIK